VLRRDRSLQPSRTMDQVFDSSQPARDVGPVSPTSSFGSSS
jgi:hypothetical protein